MTNYLIGRTAEEYAEKYLRSLGYKIIQKNWRTRYCEIDIIAERKRRMHFIEVKYRQTSSQGSGLEYITANKLQQMRFAAEFWVAENDWHFDYALGALELTGADYEITNFLPIL